MRPLGCGLLAVYANAARASPELTTEQTVDEARARPVAVSESGNWVTVPVPVANPTVGNGLQVAVLYLHPQAAGQDRAPAATSGVVAMGTDRKTRLLRYYGVGDESPFADNPVPYRVDRRALLARRESTMSNVPWLDRAILGSIAALALAAAAAPAQAQNWSSLMKDTPAEKFNDEDMRLFNEASGKALNDAAVGETVRWENPATQSRGELKVLKTFTWKDQPCREIRIHNEARARKATTTLNLCRVADQWRMVSPTEQKKG